MGAFNIAEAFAGVDFNEERLEKRFRRIMGTLSKDPRKPIYGGGANRLEAKSIRDPPGADTFNKSETPRARRAATIRRMEGQPSILAARDAPSAIMTDGGRWKATAVSAIRQWGRISIAAWRRPTGGLASGALDQMGLNRAERRNAALTRERRKSRPR